MDFGNECLCLPSDGTNQFVSKNLAKDYPNSKNHVDVALLKGTSDELDTEAFKQWRPEFKDAEVYLGRW